MRAVIGIDIGSSAVKAILLDVEGMESLGAVSQPLRSRVPGTSVGHFEEEPNILRAQVLEAVRTLAISAKKFGATIEAIAFTGQMHGGLLVDKDLEPLTNCITWQDKRGDEISKSGQRYVEKLAESAPFDPTGVGIKTGFLITSLYWFNEQNGIPKDADRVLGMYDWITSLFIGRAVTDISSAAAWGMFDPVKRSWKIELLRVAEISESLLPDVVEPGAFVGMIDSEMAKLCSLPTNVRVHASIGDTQAAYLGSGCTQNDILLNFGTGSQSLWETVRLEATPGTDIRYLGKNRYLACAPTLAGGEAYLTLARFFQDVVKEFSSNEISMGEVLRTMDRLALQSGSDRISFDPIFRGSKFRDIQDRASITGIDAENFHSSNLVRSMVEGMIEEIAKPFYLRMEERVFTGLVGEGSAMRQNPALQSIAEARFGLPFRLGKFSEAASAGAALLCLQGA